jgi:glycosyltransferase involved in cell wall biosynthesis
MKNTLISIIIPTYNRANEVTRAIASVFAQTYADYEVIVVDDGSTDNTREILDLYGNCIRYIRQKNQGVSSARNAGIRAARAEWIAFLDSDDEWLPEKLSVQVAELNENGDACLHATNHTFFFDQCCQDKTYFDVTGFGKVAGKYGLFRRPLEYQIRYGLARAQCSVVRREALFAAGLFDPKLRIYEDQDLMCRLALLGPWVVSDLPLVKLHRSVHSVLNLSRLRSSDPVGSTRSLVYIYEKLALSTELSGKERTLVAGTLRACRSARASELMKNGRNKAAREVLKKGISQQIFSGLFAKYLLSFLPSFCVARVISLWERLRSRPVFPGSNSS